MDELVAIVDADGRVCGSVRRSIMRRDNLRHAATGVLVRNDAGQIYVHRRTATKDVYPGRYDFMAGGVLLVGEEPLQAAQRELAEELGITGVPLEALPEGDYADDDTRYHAYLYQCVWNGPITHQVEEIDWGAWMSPAELLGRLADPDWSFVPDTSAMLTGTVQSMASPRRRV